jgi:hypothetical protein
MLPNILFQSMDDTLEMPATQMAWPEIALGFSMTRQAQVFQNFTLLAAMKVRTLQTCYHPFGNLIEFLDYRVFQSKIVGKWLLFWAEVQSISSAWSKTTPLSEYQIVQLWQSNGVQSIQFFRNGKDGVYSQHSSTSASLRFDATPPREANVYIVQCHHSKSTNRAQKY